MISKLISVALIVGLVFLCASMQAQDLRPGQAAAVNGVIGKVHGAPRKGTIVLVVEIPADQVQPATDQQIQAASDARVKAKEAAATKPSPPVKVKVETVNPVTVDAVKPAVVASPKNGVSPKK
jgi:hypothetical protein